jgi:uncharacterized membrane protein YkgB
MDTYQRLRNVFPHLARIALFVIFFWFGLLKIIDVSPANPLVSALLERTLPFMSFGTFIVLFSIYEMVIGICFLVPKWNKVGAVLFFLHMITTVMPLVLLPSVAWQGMWVPTLEGQYIIKNIALIALVVGLLGHCCPPNKK